MSVCVEYVESGILFTGHYLSWDSSDDAIRCTAAAVAPLVRSTPAAIESLLRFSLTQQAACVDY